MSFKDLKKQSTLGNLTDKLIQAVEKSEKTTDDRFWKLEVDKAGNGRAVLRFLPAPDGEEMPFVKLMTHWFKGPGGNYVENCLTTIGKKDPVADANRALVNQHGGDYRSIPQSVKDTVSERKRKKSYYSNVYVVKDPANPENEGKVFLFKYGEKIHEKIMKAMQPAYEDEDPINAFNLWQGANFKLVAVKKAGYRNYDDSSFAAPSPLLDDDDAMEEIWKQCYSLDALIAPDQFKSYEELQQRMNEVLNVAPTAPRVDSEVEDEESDWQAEVAPASTPAASVEDEDPELAEFQKMLNGL
jgi:hypothetical protein